MEQMTIFDVPQWVPCSERQPEKAGWYLVTEFDRYEEELTVNINEWREGGYWLSSPFEPIAWMPLPKPYTKGDNDDD